MKQKITLLICLAAAIASAIASTEYRLTIEHNLPRPGDRLQKQTIAYFSNALTGNDCFWDFSSKETDSKTSESRYASRPQSPVIKTENREQSFYQLSGDTLYLCRQASPDKSLSYILKRPSLKYPFSFGERINGYFYGEGTLDYFNHMRLAGKSETQIIGYGRMITPDNDSLHHVLLLKEIVHGATIVSPDHSVSFANTNDSTKLHPDTIDLWLNNDSITNRMETLRWYARGYRYPIIESHKVLSYYRGIVVDSISETYYISPSSQEYSLDTDIANDSLRQIEENLAFNTPFNSASPSNIGTRSRTTGASAGIGQYPANETSSDKELGDNSNSLNGEIGQWCNLSPLVVDQSTTLSYNTSSTGFVEVRIFSPSGALMWQYSNPEADASGCIECPAGDLVKGEYILTSQIGDKAYSFKFIKK